jgi:putative component of membrane protein insertase Oxa1/YidC/SpoIIIJ protein YidD
MKTLSYSRRWQYAIFRGFIHTSKGLLYSLVNSVGDTLEHLSQYRHPIVMATSQTLEQMTKQTGVALIRGYQKYLSPHKGFCCSHRVLYGGDSCSQYVKNMLIEQDLRSAISLSRQRFSACKTAKIILRAETLEEKRRREQNNSQWNCSCSPEGCLNECIPGCDDCGGDPDCGDCDCG